MELVLLNGTGKKEGECFMLHIRDKPVMAEKFSTLLQKGENIVEK